MPQENMLGLIGISYKSAPLEVREKYSFADEEAIRFVKQLKVDTGLFGAVILSTCNRTEIYFHFNKDCIPDGFDYIFRHLEFFKGTSPDSRSYFYAKWGDDVPDHLFRVVSGIESLIIGEDQIVTQVKSGFRLSLENDHGSPVLNRLFNKAFEAGKRVRSETAINKGSASISSAAVELICKKVPDIADKKILIMGAGIMGELVLLNILKRNCSSIHITNRTIDKARELGKKHNLPVVDFEKFDDALHSSDLIFVATGAHEHIITPEIVNRYVHNRASKQLFMDLSVPRNISPAISQHPQIELYAVDHLQEIVKETQNKRKEAISQAVEVINIVKQEFNDWLCSLDLTPAILNIKKSIEDVNIVELEEFFKINGISTNDEMVTRYADHLTQKYARLFIRNLKHLSDNGKNKEYIKLATMLFDLNNSNGK